MIEEFYRQLFDKHDKTEAVASNREIAAWALQVIRLLFPEQSKQEFHTVDELKDEFKRLRNELCLVMSATKACENCDSDQLSKSVFEQLPEVYRLLNTDIQEIFEGDPAARTEFEVIRTYPGFLRYRFIGWRMYYISMTCHCCPGY